MPDPEYTGESKAVHVELDSAGASPVTDGPITDSPSYLGRAPMFRIFPEAPSWDLQEHVTGPLYEGPHYKGMSQAIHVRGPVTTPTPPGSVPGCRCCAETGTSSTQVITVGEHLLVTDSGRQSQVDLGSRVSDGATWTFRGKFDQAARSIGGEWSVGFAQNDPLNPSNYTWSAEVRFLPSNGGTRLTVKSNTVTASFTAYPTSMQGEWITLVVAITGHTIEGKIWLDERDGEPGSYQATAIGSDAFGEVLDPGATGRYLSLQSGPFAGAGPLFETPGTTLWDYIDIQGIGREDFDRTVSDGWGTSEFPGSPPWTNNGGHGSVLVGTAVESQASGTDTFARVGSGFGTSDVGIDWIERACDGSAGTSDGITYSTDGSGGVITIVDVDVECGSIDLPLPFSEFEGRVKISDYVAGHIEGYIDLTTPGGLSSNYLLMNAFSSEFNLHDATLVTRSFDYDGRPFWVKWAYDASGTRAAIWYDADAEPAYQLTSASNGHADPTAVCFEGDAAQDNGDNWKVSGLQILFNGTIFNACTNFSVEVPSANSPIQATRVISRAILQDTHVEYPVSSGPFGATLSDFDSAPFPDSTWETDARSFMSIVVDSSDIANGATHVRMRSSVYAGCIGTPPNFSVPLKWTLYAGTWSGDQFVIPSWDSVGVVLASGQVDPVTSGGSGASLAGKDFDSFDILLPLDIVGGDGIARVVLAIDPAQSVVNSLANVLDGTTVSAGRYPSLAGMEGQSGDYVFTQRPSRTTVLRTDNALYTYEKVVSGGGSVDTCGAAGDCSDCTGSIATGDWDPDADYFTFLEDFGADDGAPAVFIDPEVAVSADKLQWHGSIVPADPNNDGRSYCFAQLSTKPADWPGLSLVAGLAEIYYEFTQDADHVVSNVRSSILGNSDQDVLEMYQFGAFWADFGAVFLHTTSHVFWSFEHSAALSHGNPVWIVNVGAGGVNSSTLMEMPVAVASSGGTRFSVRVILDRSQPLGSKFRVKVWRTNDPEPSSWTGVEGPPIPNLVLQSVSSFAFDVGVAGPEFGGPIAPIPGKDYHYTYHLESHTFGTRLVENVQINSVLIGPATQECAQDCVECLDPLTGGAIPDFTPGFLPTFRRQIGDPTTSLDSFICTMESAAMVLDWHTRGAISVWGGELIPWCGKTVAQIEASGTNLGNAAQAWAHYGQVLSIRSGQTFDAMLACLAEGRAVILQGDYATFSNAIKCQDSFEGFHAISVYPYQVADRLLVGDPLCSTFYGVPIAALRAYAESFGAATFGSSSPQPILFAVSRPWSPAP